MEKFNRLIYEFLWENWKNVKYNFFWKILIANFIGSSKIGFICILKRLCRVLFFDLRFGRIEINRDRILFSKREIENYKG